MNPLAMLFLALLLVPVVEIYLLIRVGEVIGAMPTVLLIVFTAMIGAWMLRQQGLAVLARAQHALRDGILPARELLEAVLLLVGGVLLLTPGLVTDVLGFVLLVPASRHRLAAALSARIVVAGAAPRGDGRTIDGEWRREDQDRDRLPPGG